MLPKGIDRRDSVLACKHCHSISKGEKYAIRDDERALNARSRHFLERIDKLRL